MKLPNPTALLHPSRMHPLASGIEVVVLSVGSMTTWQGTTVGGGNCWTVRHWGPNIPGWSMAMIASSVLQTLKESQSPMFFSADRPSTKEFPRSPPALPATLWCAPGFAHLKTTMEPK